MTPPGSPGRPPDPSQTFGRASPSLLDLLEGLPTHSGPPGGPPNYSWTFGRASQPFLDLLEGLATPPEPLGGSPNLPEPTGGSLFRTCGRASCTSWRASDTYRTFGRASRLLTDRQEGFPTPPRPPEGLPTPPGSPQRSPDTSRIFRRGSLPLQDIRKGLEHLLEGLPHLLESLPHLREGFPHLREGNSTLLDHQEHCPTPLGQPGGPPNLSRTSGKASRFLRELLEGLSTPSGPFGEPPDTSRTSLRASQPFPDHQEGP